MAKKLEMALCEGSHEIPKAVDGAIFPQQLNPLDLVGMRTTAAAKLAGVEALDLYVTGLTVALVEVINFCRANGASLTLWHFDRGTGDYYPQAVV